LLNNTDEASAVRETVAAGGVELPPPQAEAKKIIAPATKIFFILCFMFVAVFNNS
jgi:hypothetical protein